MTGQDGAPTDGATRSTRAGAGKVLVALYATFAVAATSRAGYQLLAQGDEAPLAYGLSAVAAVVYVLATVGLAVDRPWARRLAWLAVGTEAVGVLLVGTYSLLRPQDFPDPTVPMMRTLGEVSFLGVALYAVGAS